MFRMKIHVQAWQWPKANGKTTKEWLKNKIFSILELPSPSPDLNPIENQWYDLKMDVHQCYPSNLTELEKMCKHSYRTDIREQNLSCNAKGLSALYWLFAGWGSVTEKIQDGWIVPNCFTWSVNWLWGLETGVTLPYKSRFCKKQCWATVHSVQVHLPYSIMCSEQ